MVGRQFADELKHVPPESVLIGSWMAWLVDAAVDTPPQMLDEGAEQAWIRLRDRKIAVNRDFGFFHWKAPIG
jgi:hypothetical protein